MNSLQFIQIVRVLNSSFLSNLADSLGWFSWGWLSGMIFWGLNIWADFLGADSCGADFSDWLSGLTLRADSVGWLCGSVSWLCGLTLWADSQGCNILIWVSKLCLGVDYCNCIFELTLGMLSKKKIIFSEKIMAFHWLTLIGLSSISKRKSQKCRIFFLQLLLQICAMHSRRTLLRQLDWKSSHAIHIGVKSFFGCQMGVFLWTIK